MGFRRDGRLAHRWQEWRKAHQLLADAAGVPPDVMATKEDFEHLIRHAYNRAGWYNQAPWFEVTSLSPDKRGLLRVLVLDFLDEFCPQPPAGTEQLPWPLARDLNTDE